MISFVEELKRQKAERAELERFRRATRTMTLTEKIARAGGDDLDKFGELLDVPRIRADWSRAIFESDDDYRRRLADTKMAQLLSMIVA
jgi:hypothetical protein